MYRGCLFNLIWFDNNSYINKNRSFYLYNYVDTSCCIFILFYNRIFAVTFDENFTRAIGKNAETYNMIIAIITAVIIVLAMSLVGSLLISALIIFPALSAMRVMQSFKGVIIYAAVLSVIGAFFGIVLSILCSTPVGATIVILDLILFL